jgi:TGS domain
MQPGCRIWPCVANSPVPTRKESAGHAPATSSPDAGHRRRRAGRPVGRHSLPRAIPGRHRTPTAAAPDLALVPVAVLDDESVEHLPEAVWELNRLIRVFPRKGAQADERPVAPRPGATLLEVAESIHHDPARRFTGGRIWGSSVRHPGQKVGTDHVVADEDVIAVLE